MERLTVSDKLCYAMGGRICLQPQFLRDAGFLYYLCF